MIAPLHPDAGVTPRIRLWWETPPKPRCDAVFRRDPRPPRHGGNDRWVDSHSRGQRFDTSRAHHMNPVSGKGGGVLFFPADPASTLNAPTNARRTYGMRSRSSRTGILIGTPAATGRNRAGLHPWLRPTIRQALQSGQAQHGLGLQACGPPRRRPRAHRPR
ncbi:protein of unknown function [Candidatus Hydrogenisulfobacillus filiaventi]|uniref:Uncharacterized protein n=1 Tax=Candidatus Hydrogenisulfobacillus filiaventi TaxID=2707344 RepID=A0A6F8ZIP1_9FIRM|nr:protein of unknown function [Candidatus Hydrogenisulfobacillus filiaventi]